MRVRGVIGNRGVRTLPRIRYDVRMDVRTRLDTGGQRHGIALRRFGRSIDDGPRQSGGPRAGGRDEMRAGKSVLRRGERGVAIPRPRGARSLLLGRPDMFVVA